MSCLVAAAHRSSWLPAAPHLKQWNMLLPRCAEKERLLPVDEPWTGQGPRTWSALLSRATKPSKSKTWAKETDERTWAKSMAGMAIAEKHQARAVKMAFIPQNGWYQQHP